MALYSVFARRSTREKIASGEWTLDIQFVKDGFNWPALFFGPFWFIWHRMWLLLLGYVVGLTVLTFLTDILVGGSDGEQAVYFLVNLGVALESFALRQFHLQKNSFRPLSIVSGRRKSDAQGHFFSLLQEDRVDLSLLYAEEQEPSNQGPDVPEPTRSPEREEEPVLLAGTPVATS